MKRNYIILQTNTNGMGIVKVRTENSVCAVTVDINGFEPLGESEIFKTYILTDKIVCVGAAESGREVFNIRNCGNVEAAAITRKSKNNEIIEFWGGNEAIYDLLVEFINPQKQEEKTIDNTENPSENNIIYEESEMKTMYEPEKYESEEVCSEDSDDESAVEAEEKNVSPEKVYEETQAADVMEEYNPKCELPEKFTFENYFGGGFAWQKINGYYCVKNYKIIQYLMSVDNVYEAINRFGYYYFGEKKDDNTDYFAFAVPADDSRIIPFNITPEFVYRVDDNGQIYYAVCVGCDESGEFFVGLEG